MNKNHILTFILIQQQHKSPSSQLDEKNSPLLTLIDNQEFVKILFFDKTRGSLLSNKLLALNTLA